MMGKIEGRRRRGRQDEMVGWHHRLNGQESEQAPGDSEGRGAWRAAVHGGHNVLDATGGLSNHKAGRKPGTAVLLLLGAGL